MFLIFGGFLWLTNGNYQITRTDKASTRDKNILTRYHYQITKGKNTLTKALNGILAEIGLFFVISKRVTLSKMYERIGSIIGDFVKQFEYRS